MWIVTSVLLRALLTSCFHFFFFSLFFFFFFSSFFFSPVARYVVFDTQLIVEKADQGDRDFAWHAAELFIDFVGIFVRICIILMRNRDQGRGSSKEGRSERTARR